MNILQACDVIQRSRGDALLVATMGAMVAFDTLKAGQPRVSSVPLMGGAPGVGLGLALASPKEQVIVVDGDASLLMQLGNLVTVANQAPENFHHFLICNGTQFTGLSNLPVPGRDQVDFCAMARAAGYRKACAFDALNDFEHAFPALLQQTGPQFIALHVEPEPVRLSASSPQQDWSDVQFTRMHQEARALKNWIDKRQKECI
jgi:thiamine pyrophosphate-dependent acetolactate synthase large subunit-like protein